MDLNLQNLSQHHAYTASSGEEKYGEVMEKVVSALGDWWMFPQHLKINRKKTDLQEDLRDIKLPGYQIL